MSDNNEEKSDPNQPPSGSSSRGKAAPIKIASKDPQQRNSSGGADPGPGDIGAAPSTAPELVDIPEPPTASQLVVKSTSAAQGLATMKEGRSGTEPSRQISGSQAGPAASNPSVSAPAAQEPTSSRPLTGPTGGAMQSTKSLGSTGTQKSVSAQPMASSATPSGLSGPKSHASSAPKPQGVSTMKASSGFEGGNPEASVSPADGPRFSPSAASTGSEGGSGVIHDEDEVGEGEVDTDGTNTPASSPASSVKMSISPSSSHHSKSSAPSQKSTSSNIAAKSSALKSGGSSNQKSTTTTTLKSGGKSSGQKTDKKVTRFRYHKRITVRTTGKTNPESVMNKVGKPSISPSTIDEIDPKELLKRAGIKSSKHWRIRLRQTKRITKNGKTTTQTKTAYRDSSGNHQPPSCKKCGKDPKECKCSKS